MGRLHRFLDDGGEMLAQSIHVYLGAQRGTKGCHDLSRIIFATIEAAVNDVLKASSQRLEERRDHQRGGDDGKRLLGEAAGHGTHQSLQGEDEADIECHQQGGQTTIDQRAIDEHINLPQAGAQHGEPKRERDQEQEASAGVQGQCIGRTIERPTFGERWEDQRQHRHTHIDSHRHSKAEDHPFGLLTLEWTGHPQVAVELDDRKERHLGGEHEIVKRMREGI